MVSPRVLDRQDLVELADEVFSRDNIDNRLKTLLDSLSVPAHVNQLTGLAPASEENPFYCLLEDDSLVTGFEIRTERLLEPPINPNDVRLILTVIVRPTQITFETLAFLGGWL